MIDHGSGIPIVLVPGIQGRWEWMQRAADALATQNRVTTNSLPSEPGSIASINAKRGFGSFVDWLDQLLARANVDAVALCGVSYDGWIAVHYAATRPSTILSLSLVSTPSPNWQPSSRIERYLRTPRLMASVFAASSPIQTLSRSCSRISVSQKKITLRGRVPSTCRNITSYASTNG